jgi:hypothetical protein
MNIHWKPGKSQSAGSWRKTAKIFKSFAEASSSLREIIFVGETSRRAVIDGAWGS